MKASFTTALCSGACSTHCTT